MEKNWNAMEKLWKSYGISFPGICTNPDNTLFYCTFPQSKLMADVNVAVSYLAQVDVPEHIAPLSYWPVVLYKSYLLQSSVCLCQYKYFSDVCSWCLKAPAMQEKTLLDLMSTRLMTYSNKIYLPLMTLPSIHMWQMIVASTVSFLTPFDFLF